MTNKKGRVVRVSKNLADFREQMKSKNPKFKTLTDVDDELVKMGKKLTGKRVRITDDISF